MKVATKFTLVTNFLIVTITYYIDHPVSKGPWKRMRKAPENPYEKPPLRYCYPIAVLH